MTETKRYDLVETCVTQFHKIYPNGAIETSFTINGKTKYFTAKVTLDVENPTRFFTWHCFGIVLKDSAIEEREMELEAISHALATAGISKDIPPALPHKTDAAVQWSGQKSTTGNIGDMATEKQINLIVKKCNDLQISPEARKSYLQETFGTDVLGWLTKRQASEFIIALNEPKKVTHIKDILN